MAVLAGGWLMSVVGVTWLAREATQGLEAMHRKIGVADGRPGMLVAMDPAGIRQGSNPDPFRLSVKPELLMVLRHTGLDLLAYDGAPCSEAVEPLTEAARHIEADPGLRPILRSVGWDSDTVTGVVEGLRWAAERCADRLPNLPLKVRSWDGTRPSDP